MWAGALVTYIVVERLAEFTSLATFLAGIIITFVGGESWRKRHLDAMREAGCGDQ